MNTTRLNAARLNAICSLIERDYLSRMPVTEPDPVQASNMRSAAHVRPLDAKDLPTLDEALAEWSERTALFRGLHEVYLESAARLGLDADADFERWFAGLLVQVASAEWWLGSGPGAGAAADERTLHSRRDLLRRYTYQLRGLVPNLSVCRCFVEYLPESVPGRRAELAAIGRLMTQVFYLDMLGKQLDRVAAGRRPDVTVLEDLSGLLRETREPPDVSALPS